MFRFKAAGIHLLLSLAIAALSAGAVYLLWYPGDYAVLLKGNHLFVLIAICDIALGPLLTLIVWNPAKSWRERLLDYSVIAGLQLAALVYGLSVMAQSRPVVAVFSVDRFELVSAFEINPATEGATGGAPFSPSWTGPVLRTLRMPTDPQERNKTLELELQGQELQTLPGYYSAYSHDAVLARARPIDDLLARHPEARPLVQDRLARLGGDAQQVLWVPAHSRFGFHTALVLRGTEGILGFIDVDPF